MNTEALFNKQSTIFKLLADPTRLHIIYLIVFTDEELCVQDIAEKAGITQSAASHQLTKLSSNGIVDTTRQGKNVYYYLKDTPQAQEVKNIMSMKLNKTSKNHSRINYALAASTILLLITTIILTILSFI